MSDLFPDQVVSEILTRLPSKSVCRFKSVSKRWASIIVKPDFIAAYLARNGASWVKLDKDVQISDTESGTGSDPIDVASSPPSLHRNYYAEYTKEHGNRYFKGQNFDEAMAWYSKIISLSPSAVAYGDRAMAYLKVCRYREAEEDCNKCLDLDERYFKGYGCRAIARKELGDLNGAVEDVKFALALEPESKDTKEQCDELKGLLGILSALCPVTNSSQKMSSWADLLTVLLDDIFSHLTNCSNNIRASSVCRNWRAIAVSQRGKLEPQIPGLLVLPRNSVRGTLISVKEIPFPIVVEDLDNHSQDLLASKLDRPCGSNRDWVVFISEDSNLYLLNPVSKNRIFLPPLDEERRVDHGPPLEIKKVFLSSSPSFDDKKCVILVLFKCEGAAFIVLGDDCWKMPKYKGRRWGSLSDALFFNGTFYIVDSSGFIMSLDISNMSIETFERQPDLLSYMNRFGTDCIKYEWYLVDHQGDLCIVLRYIVIKYEDEDNLDSDVIDSLSTRQFEIYKFDKLSKYWDYVSDLGEFSLFLGCGTSLSISISDMKRDKIRRNCVYFIEYNTNPSRSDCGVYDMSTTTVEPLYSGSLYLPRPNLIWVMVFEFYVENLDIGMTSIETM